MLTMVYVLLCDLLEERQRDKWIDEIHRHFSGQALFLPIIILLEPQLHIT